MLAKSKLDSIETLVSQALIDMEISHAEFITILKEKDKYQKMKGNVKNLSEKLEQKQQNMRLISANSIKRFYKHLICLKCMNICIIKNFYFFCVYIKRLILTKQVYKKTT